MEPHWPNTTLALLLHSSVPKKWCEPWSCRQQERLGLLTSLQHRQGCYKPTWGHRCFHCAMPVAAHVCNWSRTSQSLNTLPGKGPVSSKVRNAWCLGRLLASLSPVTLTCIINIKLDSFPGLYIYVIQVLDVNEKEQRAEHYHPLLPSSWLGIQYDHCGLLSLLPWLPWQMPCLPCHDKMSPFHSKP